LTYSGFPSAQSKTFFLLRDLGIGAEGAVWLACNSSGKLCALKIFKVSKDKGLEISQRIQLDVKIWKNVWKLKAFSTDFAAGAAKGLIMPHVKIYSDPNDIISSNTFLFLFLFLFILLILLTLSSLVPFPSPTPFPPPTRSRLDQVGFRSPGNSLEGVLCPEGFRVEACRISQGERKFEMCPD